MEDTALKKEIDRLVKIKGELRGIAIKDDFNYILYREGKEGINRLEKEMARIGYPLKYKDIKSMKFYPVGLETVIMLVNKKIFNYQDEDFKKLGEWTTRLPLIIRLFMKFFGSVELAAKGASRMWRTYFTVGDLKVVKLDIKKRYTILRLTNWNFNPIHCLSCQGFFMGVVKLIHKENVTCEETKCVHRGDEYHEFLIKW